MFPFDVNESTSAETPKHHFVVMSENGSSFPAHFFPANRFKALDYAFEKSTRVKVTMNLLALPAPFLSGASNLYPHDGQLPEDTYRTPWIRGKVISSCKLLVGGSVMEDLGDVTQVNFPERFDLSLTEMSEDAEVIPSSYPESLKYLDQDDYICHLKESQNSSRQESFLKLIPEQIKPDDKDEDLLLPEDLMIVDYLPQFKRHLPTVRAKLSRLRTLPVSDPLLRSAVGTEDSTFSFINWESYDCPPDVKIGAIQMCGSICDKFDKESPAAEEALLLPTVVDAVDLTPACFTTFSSLCGVMTAIPEQLADQPPVLDVLHEGVTASVEISQYETHEEPMKWKIRPTEAEMAGHSVLPTEVELDLTLSPETRLTPINLSTCELQVEELSPHCRLTLLSAKTQTEMEAALWKAEKHPSSVVAFLLAAPQMCEPDVCVQSLSEVIKVLKLERQSLTCTSDDMQGFLHDSCEFTEKMRSEVPSDIHRREEDFEKLSLQDFEVTENIYLKKQESGAFHANATPDETHLQRETFPKTSQKSAVNTSGVSDTSTYEVDIRSKGRVIQRDYSLEQVASFRLNHRDNHRGALVKKRPPEESLDPLSSFMMLRAEQSLPVEATQKRANPPESQPNQQTPEPQPSPGQMHKSSNRLNYTLGAASENVREQEPACQSTEDLSSQHVHRSVCQSSIDVQATDSQKRAYWELLAFAEPFLESARQLGLDLPVRGGFICLDPDQTHFLLKQQEKALCRTHAQSEAPLRDREVLLDLAALAHALVVFKELLLNRSLRAALDYLTRTAEACAQQNLQQLLKRLRVILFLSNKIPETNFKLLELQHQLSTWLRSRKGPATTERVLVLMSVDCDDSRSVILTSLSQVTGGAVTAVFPEEGKNKLNGASLVSSMQGAACVVVCEQHVGPDFPWNCFSLAAEYDHPGRSPWAAICKEKGIDHFTFNTVVSDSEEEESPWCLEDGVPHVLFVTEGLRSCPRLLQTLESGFNVTAVERRHCPTLEMLGGTHRYAVLTVDERTCIVIQEEDELCLERASEVMVMRLSALCLQYSCCWLILHCPDSQGGGLSGAAFSNLVLVYSSLELFRTQKSEDLNVKVLIAYEVTEVAKWISRICFHTLMSADRDPHDFLDRDWLSVIASEDEKRLLLFPCINPLVGQLMLKRAPAFHWLLGATLPQLQELLPEVPQKVLKLFSDTASMFPTPSGPAQSQMRGTGEGDQTTLRRGWWDDGRGPELAGFQPEPEPEPVPGFLFCSDRSSRAPFGNDTADFRLDLSSFFGGQFPLQGNWSGGDPWKDERRRRSVETAAVPPGRSGRAGVLGGVVQRVQANSARPLGMGSASSPAARQPVRPRPAFRFSDSQPLLSGLSPPQGFLAHDPSGSIGAAAASASYGTRCLMGQERKRSGGASVLTPLKKGRLSYERVPGRSDGQTRLKLF